MNDVENGINGLQSLNPPALNLSSISLPAAAKWLAAIAVAEWVKVPGAMRTLVLLMIVDYGTGLATAFVRGELSSRVGIRGLLKKFLILVLLLVAHVAEQAAGRELNLETVGAIAYIVTELISIVENVARAGVPIPQPLVSALLAAKKLQKMATPDQIEQLGAADGQTAPKARAASNAQ